MTQGQRAVLYARVSSDDRGKDGRNLKGQLEMCGRHSQAQGYQVIKELAEDDRGASGADLDLEQLTHVREMAQAGEFDVLVVREIDRLARSLAKQLIVEEELRRAGVHIDYVLGEYPDTPEGNLNKNIKAVIAEYERLKITERNTRGRRNVVKGGSVMLHGAKNAPFGYRMAESKRMLEGYEPEAQIVRMIFDWCVNGDGTRGPMGAAAIAAKLSKMGIPTRRVRAHGWAATTVHQMLHNSTYCGTWRYAKSSDAPISLRVPAVVSKETWDRAQKQRKENKANAPRRLKYQYLLRRHVICGHCQAAMTGRARKHKSGVTLYYRCAARCHPRNYSHKCDNSHYRADAVDAAVWDVIKGWMLNPDSLVQKVQERQEAKAQENEPLRVRLGVVGDLLDQNQEQLERLLDLYLSGDFPKEVLTDRKARLEATIQALEQERDQLASTLEDRTLAEDQIETIYSLAAVVRQGLAEGDDDFSTRRAVIETLHPQVKLYMEDGRKMAWLSCVLGSDAVDLVNVGSQTYVHKDHKPLVLTARIVLSDYAQRKAAAA